MMILGSGELDRRLARGASPAESRRLSRRAACLTSRRTRRELACALERVVEQAEQPQRCSVPAVPVHREAVRRARPGLLALAHELDDLDEAVSVRGVARASELVMGPDSPLYAPARDAAPEHSLERAVRHARATLALG